MQNNTLLKIARNSTELYLNVILQWKQDPFNYRGCQRHCKNIEMLLGMPKHIETIKNKVMPKKIIHKE